LVRARSDENGCFVFAAAQGGAHEKRPRDLRHSLIVDPWAASSAEGGLEPGIVLAEIDLRRWRPRAARVAFTAARAPVSQHDRAGAPWRPLPFPPQVGEPLMIRYALVCARGHTFEKAGFHAIPPPTTQSRPQARRWLTCR